MKFRFVFIVCIRLGSENIIKSKIKILEDFEYHF